VKEVGGFPFQRKWTAFLGLILTLLETASVHTGCRSCPALPDPGNLYKFWKKLAMPVALPEDISSAPQEYLFLY